MHNYIEHEISFFDSEEVRERKKNWWKNLSENELNEIEQIRKDLEGVPSADPEQLYWDDEDYFDFPGKCTEIVYSRGDSSSQKAVVDKAKNSGSIEVVKPQVVTESIVPAKFELGTYKYIDGSLVYAPLADCEEYIGNFWIEVECEIVSVEEVVNEQNIVIDKIETVYWDLRIYCAGMVFQARAKLGDLYNERELLKITKDRSYIEPTKEAKREFKKYLNSLVVHKNCPTIYEYAVVGWIKVSEEKMVYVTDKGVIGHPEMSIRSSAPYRFEYDKDRVGTKAIFDEFYLLKKLSAKKPENSTFLMHYLCVAVMTTIFQEAGHPINLSVALIGSTNSQKTSSAIVFTRIFDRTVRAIPDIRFNSTEVAIIEKMECYGDAILLVDDFLPYEDKRLISEQMKKSETVIRSYGDRVSRKRSKVYAKMNNVSEYSRIKGCCMITGEIFDTSSESSQTRVIQLAFEQGDIDLKLLSFFQNNLLNVPTFIYSFVKFLDEKQKELIRIIKNEVGKARMDLSTGIRTPRFRDSLGIFRAELQIFYWFVREKGYMNTEEIQNAFLQDYELITKVICTNDANVKVKSPATIVCTALKKGMTMGIVDVINEDKAKVNKDFSSVVIETEEYFQILPDTLWILYKTYCSEMRKDIVFKNGRELAAPLKKEEAIMVKTETKSTRATHKINANTEKRFFFIKKTKFFEFSNVFDSF